MNSETVALLVGTGIGLLSAIIIELLRYYLGKRKAKSDSEMQDKKEKESFLRDFLSPEEDAKRYAAWLKLIDTPKIPPKTYGDITNKGNTYSEKPRQISKLASFIKSLFVRKIRTEKQREVARTEPLTEAQINSIIVSEGGFLEKYILVQTQIIGRQKDCEIRLIDEYVSRLHALIRFENGNYVIYDLGSTSGTYVNKAKVGPTGKKLYNQDTIVVGESVFRFESTKILPVSDNAKNNSKTKPRKDIDTVSEMKTAQLKRRKTNRDSVQKPKSPTE